jgi:hypothetical protein
MQKTYTEATKRAIFIEKYGFAPTGNLGVDAVAAIIHYDRKRGMPPKTIYLCKEYFSQFKKFAMSKVDDEQKHMIESGEIQLEFDGVLVKDAGVLTNKRWFVEYIPVEVNA